MPPAFNLSQDQTLQFNLCFDCNAFLHQSFLKILTRFLLSKSLLSSVNVCFFSFATNKRPRLSSVFFLKIISLLPPLLFSTKRFVCHQHRNEIMHPFLILVNNFFYFIFLNKIKIRYQLPSSTFASLRSCSGEMRLWAYSCSVSTPFSLLFLFLSFHNIFTTW